MFNGFFEKLGEVIRKLTVILVIMVWWGGKTKPPAPKDPVSVVAEAEIELREEREESSESSLSSVVEDMDATLNELTDQMPVNTGGWITNPTLNLLTDHEVIEGTEEALSVLTDGRNGSESSEPSLEILRQDLQVSSVFEELEEEDESVPLPLTELTDSDTEEYEPGFEPHGTFTQLTDQKIQFFKYKAELWKQFPTWAMPVDTGDFFIHENATYDEVTHDQLTHDQVTAKAPSVLTEGTSQVSDSMEQERISPSPRRLIQGSSSRDAGAASPVRTNLPDRRSGNRGALSRTSVGLSPNSLPKTRKKSVNKGLEEGPSRPSPSPLRLTDGETSRTRSGNRAQQEKRRWIP